MTLTDHLQEQRAHLEQLLDLLHEERRLLAAGLVDGARLSQLAEEKRGQLAQLEKMEQQRRQGLRRLGYSDDRAGDERAASESSCLPLWRGLRDRVEQAAELNRSNGVLIGIRTEHNQRLLNALRDAAGRGLYGPDGQAHGRGARVSSRA